MHRLIVMLPNNLGDVIMALPVLEAIKAARPHARISFFVEEGYEGGLLGNRCCDRILKFPRKSIKASATAPQWYEGVASLRSIVDEIKSDGCDAVINLAQHPYVSYLATLLDASRTFGQRLLREGNHALPDVWSQYLYAVPFARRYNALHATDVYCRIAGVTSGHGGTAVTITPDEKTRAANWLADHGCPPDERMAVVQPGAAWSSKRWPSGAFIALGKRLARDGYHIVVTGAASERPVASAIADALGERRLLAAGELSFRETMALLPYGRFVVCGDTAVMHAAAALGVKVYALFGPTSPVETGPYGNGHVVVAGRCPKRPCFAAECTTRQCMQSISPDTIYGCIRGETVVGRECDIFTTGFSGGTFRTEPLGGPPHPYYDKAGAALTRKAFELEYAADPTDGDSPVERSRSSLFIGQCGKMERLLGDYLADRNPERLRAFERQRAEAAAGDGIISFWNALLNIRLNSVPLLDPVAGIGLSIEQCRFTAEQISRAVAP
ncbi:MAG: glycosyltransferase family 9 protein [Chitinispirillaceae bacterium]|nr:glycosyltransferase family 9 protein [Chitinispirillaceae bacterium]